MILAVLDGRLKWLVVLRLRTLLGQRLGPGGGCQAIERPFSFHHVHRCFQRGRLHADQTETAENLLCRALSVAHHHITSVGWVGDHLIVPCTSWYIFMNNSAVLKNV